jgi:hypothetical protein
MQTVLAQVRVLQSGYACLVNLVLAGSLFANAWKFSALSEREYHQSLLPSSPTLISRSTYIVAAIFAARAIYDGVSSAGAWRLPDFPPITGAIFAFYFGFELVPMFTLLLLMLRTARGPAAAAARRPLHDVIAEAAQAREYGTAAAAPPDAGRAGAPDDPRFLRPDMDDEDVLNAWVDDMVPPGR